MAACCWQPWFSFLSSKFVHFFTLIASYLFCNFSCLLLYIYFAFVFQSFRNYFCIPGHFWSNISKRIFLHCSCNFENQTLQKLTWMRRNIIVNYSHDGTCDLHFFEEENMNHLRDCWFVGHLPLVAHGHHFMGFMWAIWMFHSCFTGLLQVPAKEPV